MFAQNNKDDVYLGTTLVQKIGESHLKELVSTVISELKRKKGIETESIWSDMYSIIQSQSIPNDFEIYSKIIDDIVLYNLERYSGEAQSTIWQLTLDGKKWLYENNFKTFLDVFKSNSYDKTVTVRYVRLAIYNAISAKSSFYFH